MNNTVQHQNPFVGLRPYESSDSLYYFGRNAQCKTLLRKLHQHRFVAVVGSSGSGKSSLIRAGLIPQLQAGFLVQERDHWLVANMKPGEAPLLNLINSLPHSKDNTTQNQQASRETLCAQIEEQGTPVLLQYLSRCLQEHDSNLFILVDQFEELFRFATGNDEQQNVKKRVQREQAQEFVALILQLAEQNQLPIYVCLTMRSDFLGDCDAFYGLPEAINTSQFLVPRLTRNQRSEVISNPIHLASAQVTPRLVDKLLNENIDTRDDLPVLQHALMRTFDNWLSSEDYPNNAIDIKHYQAIYTIHKALNSHANEALEELNDKQKAIAERLFQTLTTVDAGNRRIRRPAHLNEVCAISQATAVQVLEVINRFRNQGRSFLVLSSENADDNPIIDISHESLIRQWKQLADWVDEEADSAKTYRRLVESAQLNKEKQANFYREMDLEQALEWQKTQQPSEIWARRYSPDFTLAMHFLEQSQGEDEKQKKKAQAVREKQQQLLKEKAELEQQKRVLAEQQAEQQHKALKKSRLLSAFMAVFAVAMIFAVISAWFASQESIRDKDKALVAESMAEKALEKTEQQILESNFYLAKAYEQKIQIAIEAGNKDKGLTKYREAWLYALEAQHEEIPKGKTALKQASFNQVTNFSIKALNPEKTSPLPPLNIGESINAVTYSPNGKVIASVSGKTIKLWDANSGKLKQTLNGHEGWINAVSYSPDGRVIASASSDKTIKLWDANSGKLKQTLNGHEGWVRAVSYSPDGRVIASASSDKTIKLWDANSGKLKQTLNGHEDYVRAVSYSPDGSVIASASSDKTIKLWDANSGKLKQTLNGHDRSVNAVSYSPDGSVIASASYDKTIKLWDKYALLTQDLFYKYDPVVVSSALQFLWEMGLDKDDLRFTHKVRTPALYPNKQGYYYSPDMDVFMPLLMPLKPNQNRADVLIEWLEARKAYKKVK